jgi:gliding motility associated protien GldN
MKKILLFSVAFLIAFTYGAFAQTEDVLNNESVTYDDSNAEEGEEGEEEELYEPMKPKMSLIDQKIVSTKKPVEYSPIREEDVVWSRVVWRMIDCRERMNFHLYYPTDDMSTRKSLIQALIDAIAKKRIQPYADEFFKEKRTFDDVLTDMDAKGKVRVEQDMETGTDTTIYEQGSFNWGEVREYMIKEEWFIDKRHSKMDVRILGICPIRVFKKNPADKDELRTQLFWTYFPEARRVLANTVCFNGQNNTANLSFDDIFYKRRFSSRIDRASNSVNDRRIEDYTQTGLDAMLESERLKTEMMQKESDLWSF